MQRFLTSMILLACISLSINCSKSEDDGFPYVPVPSNLSFSCGGSATCNVFLPVCEASTSGANPSSTNYSCKGLPESCVESYSCECLEQSEAFANHRCQTSNNGEITVSIQYP